MTTALFALSTSALTAVTAQGAPAGGNLLNLIVPYAAIFALFYFLFIRPQQKQRKALEERIRKVKRGDEIVSAGGVIGEVVHIKETVKDGAVVPTMEDRITIRSAEARIIIERRAITRVLAPSAAEEAKPK